MPVSLRCSCYHEAGHAVAWVVIGDRLCRVDCRRSLRSAGQTQRRGGQGLSSCSQCGGTEMRDACPTCTRIVTNHLMGHLAGGAATSYLLREEHTVAQSKDDHDKVKRLLREFSDNEQIRQSVRSQAEQKAQDLVRREEKAISALAAVLMLRGVVDGPEAEQIIKEHLETSAI